MPVSGRYLIDDEASWSSHGEFVSHVNAVVNSFRKEGVLDNRESSTIGKAAAQSKIGKVEGYKPIFDGTAASLAGWPQAGPGKCSLLPDGSLRGSGSLGMFWYAGQKLGDFSVRLQYRDVAPGTGNANSGVFIRFPDPRTPLADRPADSCGTVGSARTAPEWFAIYCGQEIQIYDGATGEAQKTGSVYNFKPLGLDKAGVTPKGRWNDYEIRAVGQHYTIIRNGVVINEFDNTPGKSSSREGDPPTDLRQFLSGYVGLQHHSNNDLIEFRNIRVRDL
ncbi:DUF1080 domain-containing protein [Streptomyces flaveolus]|uniref:3-keto-disaccharide hydrolase n=1 Tax=Streptomyces flaveolus TaxID=67297 RepID=UPI00342D248E